MSFAAGFSQPKEDDSDHDLPSFSSSSSSSVIEARKREIIEHLPQAAALEIEAGDMIMSPPPSKRQKTDS
jgi:hypothetical protein